MEKKKYILKIFCEDFYLIPSKEIAVFDKLIEECEESDEDVTAEWWNDFDGLFEKYQIKSGWNNIVVMINPKDLKTNLR